MTLLQPMTETMMRYFRADPVTVRLLKSAQLLAFGVLGVCALCGLALLTGDAGQVAPLAGFALILAILTLVCEGLAQVRKPMKGPCDIPFYDYHVQEFSILSRLPRSDLRAAIGRGETLAYTGAMLAAAVLLVVSATLGDRMMGEGVALDLFRRVTPPAMLAAGYLLTVEQRKKFRRALEP